MVTCTWVSCVKIEKKNKQDVSDNQSFIIQKCMGMNRILCTYRLFAVGFFCVSQHLRKYGKSVIIFNLCYLCECD